VRRVDRLRRRVGNTAIVGVTMIVMAALVYPTFWMLVASLKTPDTMFSAVNWRWTLANFNGLFNAGFGRNLINSLFLCISSVMIATFISVNAAYVFARMKFRWRKTLFGAVLFGQTFPWIILVTPIFVLFARTGFLNTWPSMIFVYVAIAIPFSIYLLVGYLRAIPQSLDEAAIIDGANYLQIVWWIIFPIMLPGVVATATYAFLLCWSEYLFSVAILTVEDMKTMPVALYVYFGENVTDWGHVMAGSALMTLPTLLLFLPFQKYMVSGLAAGSVKQ
jgi:ABC-type glycerol-3-phosphate transport system permease component